MPVPFTETHQVGEDGAGFSQVYSLNVPYIPLPIYQWRMVFHISQNQLSFRAAKSWFRKSESVPPKAARHLRPLH